MAYIEVNRSSYSREGYLKSHFHEAYEIYCLACGSVRYIIGDKIYDLHPGDVALIPKGVIHNTAYRAERTERMLINFSYDAIGNISLLRTFCSGVISLSEQGYSHFSAVFSKMQKESAATDKYSESLLLGYLNEILVLLARSGEKYESAELSYYGELMQEVIRYINENYASALTLDALSSRFSLSKSFFSRKFKEITGFCLFDYITLVRIKNAERLLTEGKLSVTEVAYATGFNDSSYFTGVFKRLIGTTPKKYKKAL